jgi:hypothetical protein
MTNLIEKSLLLGFSIFLLTIFSSILIPFLNEINNFNTSDKPELDSYLDFFDEIDRAVCFIIDSPDISYQNEVNYPKDLNITIFEYFIIFEFKIKNDNISHILMYNVSFINCSFHNLPPQMYLLDVSFTHPHIIVNFLKLN